MPDLTKVAWTLATTQPLAVHCWDEECVIYDPDSGNTHLTSRFAAAVADVLARGPASLEALEAVFALDVDDAAAPGSAIALRRQLESILAGFEQIELVARSRS